MARSRDRSSCAAKKRLLDRIGRVQQLRQQRLRKGSVPREARQKGDHPHHVLALAGDALADEHRQRRAKAVAPRPRRVGLEKTALAPEGHQAGR
jgi:hypothetical protein